MIIAVPKLSQYYEMLEKHDWYYSFSDSLKVFEKGREEAIKLNEIALNSPNHAKLYGAFFQHYASGPGFNCPKLPKPEKPV